ncbi:pantoate--beta-alanine ligase [Negadavirga shengliensis]|uniref:Pantothenate synthetase n=1 Tax=Negadavirga shengliensis TaxID=1389218 RepID=A0ABV9T0P2_9BACT
MHLFCCTNALVVLEILHTISAVRSALKPLKATHKTIGLVPTMGALHEGHLELVKKSKLYSEFTVVTIFVNPIQFNNSEDLEKYPRQLEKDLEKLRAISVDFVFIPEISEIYPHPVGLTFQFGDLENLLEGSFRPGHFNGVAIIVSKLFHIIQPDSAFFGQKDLQQVAVIKRLVRDLSFDLEIKVVPTMREPDGLALSSRNLRLSSEGRKNAKVLFEVITECRDELLKGENWFQIREKAKLKLDATPSVKLEYLEMVLTDEFKPVDVLVPGESHSICIAAFVENIRLIDNINFSPENNIN